MNDDNAYETPDVDVTKRIERNEAWTKSEISREEKPSVYMSLKENREPENDYQSLQNPVTSARPHHRKGADVPVVRYKMQHLS